MLGMFSWGIIIHCPIGPIGLVEYRVFYSKGVLGVVVPCRNDALRSNCRLSHLRMQDCVVILGMVILGMVILGMVILRTVILGMFILGMVILGMVILGMVILRTVILGMVIL